MKNTILALVTAAHCTLPITILAQGSFLVDPNDPNRRALVVVPGGNVGIGTERPIQGTMVIAASNSATAFTGPNEQAPGTVAIQNSDATAGNFSLITFNDGLAWTATAGLGTWNTEHAFDSHGCHADLAFFTKQRGSSVLSERMRITSAGDVGIGTTIPTSPLHIHQIGGEGLRFSRSTFPGYFSVRFSNNGIEDALSFDSDPTTQLLVLGRSGNVGIGTATPAAKLDVAGKVNCTVLELTSDRAQKGGFGVVNTLEVLSRVVTLPLATWHYTNEIGVIHIGPMAQDFKAAFDVGSDDKHIATVDADGVLFAAVQGLNQKFETALREKDARIAALESKLSRLEECLAANLAATERFMAPAAAIAARHAEPVCAKAHMRIESE